MNSKFYNIITLIIISSLLWSGIVFASGGISPQTAALAPTSDLAEIYRILHEQSAQETDHQEFEALGLKSGLQNTYGENVTLDEITYDTESMTLSGVMTIRDYLFSQRNASYCESLGIDLHLDGRLREELEEQDINILPLLAEVIRVIPQKYRPNIGHNGKLAISLVDTSPSLFVDCTRNGFIGINKIFLDLLAKDNSPDKTASRLLLMIGLEHELYHEGITDSQELLARTKHISLEDWLLERATTRFVYGSIQYTAPRGLGIRTVTSELEKLLSEIIPGKRRTRFLNEILRFVQDTEKTEKSPISFAFHRPRAKSHPLHIVSFGQTFALVAIFINIGLDFLLGIFQIPADNITSGASFFNFNEPLQILVKFLLEIPLFAWLQELLFRQLLFGKLQKRLSPGTANVIQALLFMTFHYLISSTITTGYLCYAPFFFFLGLIFGYTKLLGGLSAATLAHIGYSTLSELSIYLQPKTWWGILIAQTAVTTLLLHKLFSLPENKGTKGAIRQGKKSFRQTATNIRDNNFSEITSDPQLQTDIQAIEKRCAREFKDILGTDEPLRIITTTAVALTSRNFSLGFYSHAPKIKKQLIKLLTEEEFNRLFPRPTLVLNQEMLNHPDPLVRQEYIYHEATCHLLGHYPAIINQQLIYQENYLEGEYEEDNNIKYLPGRKGNSRYPFKGNLGRALREVINNTLNNQTRTVAPRSLPETDIPENIQQMEVRAELLGLHLPVLEAEVINERSEEYETIVIRPYQPSDKNRIGQADELNDMARFRDQALNSNSGILLVAESPLRIEGLIHFHLEDRKEALSELFRGYKGKNPQQTLAVFGLAVHPDNQYHCPERTYSGIGKLLLAAATQSSVHSPAINKKHQGSLLAVNARELNTSIEDPRGFYEEIGMKKIGRSTNYYFPAQKGKILLKGVSLDLKARDLAAEAEVEMASKIIGPLRDRPEVIYFLEKAFEIYLSAMTLPSLRKQEGRETTAQNKILAQRLRNLAAKMRPSRIYEHRALRQRAKKQLVKAAPLLEQKNEPAALGALFTGMENLIKELVGLEKREQERNRRRLASREKTGYSFYQGQHKLYPVDAKNSILVRVLRQKEFQLQWEEFRAVDHQFENQFSELALLKKTINILATLSSDQAETEEKVPAALLVEELDSFCHSERLAILPEKEIILLGVGIIREHLQRGEQIWVKHIAYIVKKLLAQRRDSLVSMIENTRDNRLAYLTRKLRKRNSNLSTEINGIIAALQGSHYRALKKLSILRKGKKTKDLFNEPDLLAAKKHLDYASYLLSKRYKGPLDKKERKTKAEESLALALEVIQESEYLAAFQEKHREEYLANNLQARGGFSRLFIFQRGFKQALQKRAISRSSDPDKIAAIHYWYTKYYQAIFVPFNIDTPYLPRERVNNPVFTAISQFLQINKIADLRQAHNRLAKKDYPATRDCLINLIIKNKKGTFSQLTRAEKQLLTEALATDMSTASLPVDREQLLKACLFDPLTLLEETPLPEAPAAAAPSAPRDTTALLQYIEDIFAEHANVYTSPEQEYTFKQRIRAALNKAEAINQNKIAEFQDEELFRSRDRTPISAKNFAILNRIANSVNSRHPGLLPAVLGLLDIGKILEFRDDPDYRHLNFANHPEAGATILGHKGAFRESGFSTTAEELALTLVAQHGFIGQTKRGEVTTEIFIPILQLAIEHKDPYILEFYFLINVIDTAVVWEGLFTEDFFNWFFAKVNELGALAQKAIRENKTAREIIDASDTEVMSASETMTDHAIARLHGMRPQSAPEEIKEAVFRLFARAPRARDEFLWQLSRQKNSFSFWFPELALAWLDLDDQIKFIYLALQLAETGSEKKGKPIDINFYDLAREANRRDESRLSEENRRYLARVIGKLKLRDLFDTDKLEEIRETGLPGIDFEFDEDNNTLQTVFDPFAPLALSRGQAQTRISELEQQISRLSEEAPLHFVKEDTTGTAKKVGVFAASFDPLQRSHKLIIEKALKEFNLDEIVLVISPKHIMKEEFGASLAERIFMLEEEVKSFPNVSIVISNSGRFVETAELLADPYPEAQFSFIMGFDNFEEMMNEDKSGNTREDLDKFFKKNRLIVTPRGYNRKRAINRVLQEQEKTDYYHFIKYLLLPRENRFDSSTEARRRLRERIPENQLIPTTALRIIKALKLYTKKKRKDVKIFRSKPLPITFVHLTSPRHRIISQSQGIDALTGDLRRQFGEEVLVSTIDTQFGMSAAEVIAEFKRRQTAVIALSAQLESQTLLHEILDEIKTDPYFQNKNILTVIGSNLPTNENEELLRKYPFAVTVRGEGELAMREIVQYMRGEISLYDVHAASFVRRGKIIENDGVPITVQDLGLPARDELPEILRRGGDIWLETSRGCGWGRCAYCYKDPFRAHKWQPFPNEVVIAGLQQLHDAGAKHVSLTDPEFFGGGSQTMAGIRRARQLAEEIIKHGIKLKIAFSFRADSICNPKDSKEDLLEKMETFRLLKKCGFENAFLGIESGSDAQLKEYGKGISAAQNQEAIRRLRALGFNVCIGFIPFDPYADLETLKKNVAFIEDNDLFLEVSFPLNQLKVQANTEYYIKTLADGLLGERRQTLHTYDCHYQDPAVQRIVDIVNHYAREIGSVMYVLKYMYRTKSLNALVGEELECQILKEFFIKYNKLEIAFLKALVENIHNGRKLHQVITNFREKRLALILDVEEEITRRRIKDENGTLKAEIEKIRQLLADYRNGILTVDPEYSITALIAETENPIERITDLFQEGFPQALEAQQSLSVYTEMIKERGDLVLLAELPVLRRPLRRLEMHLEMSDDLKTLTISKVLDDSQVYGADGSVDYGKLELEHVTTLNISRCPLMNPDNYIAKNYSGPELTRIQMLYTRGGRYTKYRGVTTNNDSRSDVDTWSTNIDTAYLHKVLEEIGIFARQDIKTVLEVGTGGGHLATACAQNIGSLEQLMISDISPYALMAAIRNILPQIRGRDVTLEPYLGKGITKMPPVTDLMIVNPPYIPVPPWKKESHTTVDDPYEGTGLIREIIAEGIDHLNPDNPDAAIIMNYSSLAENDVQDYLRAYGDLIEVETLSEGYEVPLKIEKVDQQWLDWMRDKGLIVKDKVPIDGFEYWHKLKVIRIKPKKIPLSFKNGEERSFTLHNLQLHRRDAEQWKNLTRRSKLQLLSLTSIDPADHPWLDQEWRNLYALVCYYRENVPKLQQAMEEQLKTKIHLSPANLLQSFYCPDKFFAGNIIRDIYFGGKYPRVSLNVIAAMRNLMNAAPPEIKQSLIAIFQETFTLFSWDKGISQYLSNEHQYNGNYEITDITDTSVGNGVYKISLRLTDLPQQPTIEIFFKRAPPRHSDLRNEDAYLSIEKEFLPFADLERLPYYYHNPDGPDLLLTPAIEKQSLGSKLNEALRAGGKWEERISEITVQQQLEFQPGIDAELQQQLQQAETKINDSQLSNKERLLALRFIAGNREYIKRSMALQDTVDYHCHTTASDGSEAPAQLIFKAWLNGLRAVAAIDHITLAGVEEAMQAAEILGGIDVVPGIEFYSGEDNLQQLHLVTYFPLVKNTTQLKELQRQLEKDFRYQKMQRTRENRLSTIQRIIDNFNQLSAAQGFELTAEDLNQVPFSLATLYELAILLKKKYPQQLGKMSIGDIREKYLRPAFLQTRRTGITKMKIAEILELSALHGGLTSIPHPLQDARYKNVRIANIKKLLRKYATIKIADKTYPGFRAMAVYGRGITGEDTLKLRKMLRELAAETPVYRQYPLVLLNESDYHGKGENRELIVVRKDQQGRYWVPPAVASYLHLLDLRRQARLIYQDNAFADTEITNQPRFIPGDQAFLQDISFILAEHAALGDILGRNDRHLSNTRIATSDNWEIERLVDFDVPNMLDTDTAGENPWALNYDWIIEDIKQGVSEITVLSLLDEYRPDSSKRNNKDRLSGRLALLCRWQEIYLRKWQEITRPENTEQIEQIIRDTYQSTPKVVEQKLAVLQRWLRIKPRAFLDRIFRAQLLDYETRKLYQHYLSEIKEKAGERPLGFLRKYLPPENGDAALASRLETFRGVLSRDFLKRRRIGKRESIEEVFSRIEALVGKTLGQKELARLRRQRERIRREAEFIITNAANVILPPAEEQSIPVNEEIPAAV